MPEGSERGVPGGARSCALNTIVCPLGPARRSALEVGCHSPDLASDPSRTHLQPTHWMSSPVQIGHVQFRSVRGVAVVVLLVAAACANPVPPRGGPQDTTPPTVIRTQPVRDTVNVSTDTRVLLLEFSEYVDRGSLPQALSVTPQFERRLQFDWSGRAVEIEFPEPLRDGTTYIFTVDTNLSDVHGVSLENPITIAFSTGPRINRGQIRGRVVGGRRGQPKKQVDVFAYALPRNATAPPRPLPDRPSYRTQTGEDGTFAFDYMREQGYYVVALQDNNRNRQPDGLEPYATPPRLSLRADSTAGPVPVPWLFTRTDTIAPTPQRVRPVSRQRFEVSFSEPVTLETRAPAAWAPRDSTTGARAAVRSVYTVPGRQTDVAVRTEPLQDARYELILDSAVVADTAGLGSRPDTLRFGSATRPDTMTTRFRRFLPQNLPRDSAGARSLVPGMRPGVRFNQAPDSAALRAGLAVRDTTGQARDFSVTTDDGTAYWIETEPPLAPDQRIDVFVSGRPLAGRDTTYERRFRRVTSRVLGELAGRVAIADTSREMSTSTTDSTVAASRSGAGTDTVTATQSVRVDLTTSQSTIPVDRRQVTVSPDSAFVFEQLPEGQYRFRAYFDRNGNGCWDGGQLLPYVPAEPVTWLEQPVEARPRWTTELPLPLRIPILVPGTTTQTPPPADTSRADEGP